MPYHAAPSCASGQNAELLFILSDVPHVEVLLAGLREGVEAHILPTTEDALTRMAEALRLRHGLEVIHLVSHGEAGALRLGALHLDASRLSARADDLAAFGEALTQTGEVLVYGCEIAAGNQGRAFVEALARAMGARVAASATPTGAAEQGGDWELEVVSHKCRGGARPLAFVAPALEAYAGLLAVNAPPTLGGTPWPWPTAVAGSTVEAPDLTVGDADGDLLEVTLSPGFGLIGGVTDEDPTMEGVQLRGAAADLNVKLAGLTFTPEAEGFAWINITVSDGTDVAAGSLMYNVLASGDGSGDGGDPPAGNHAPAVVVPILPQAEAPAGVEIEVLDPVIEDADDDPLQVTLTSYNGVIGGVVDEDADVPGIQLSGSAAELTASLADLTFTADRGDDLAWIDIEVSDGALSGLGTIMMTATGGNAAPAFAGLNDAETPAPVQVGQVVDLPDFTVSDTDGDSLVLTIIPGAVELSGVTDTDADADGIQLVGTAEEINAQLATARVKVSQGGLDFIQMSLEDGHQLFPTWGTLWLNAPPNAAPTLAGLTLDDVQVRWGVASPLPDFTVDDADGDILTLTLVAMEGEIGGVADADPTVEGVQLSGAAEEINAQLIGVTYKADHKGHGLIRVEVTDGREETITWINLSAKPNGAPSISGAPAGPLNARPGASVALSDLAVSDPDGDALTVTLFALNGVLGGVTDDDPAREGIQLAGSAAEINAQLAGTTFTAAAPGPAKVEIHLSDGLVPEPVKATVELEVEAPPPPEPPPPLPEPPPPPPEPPPVTETVDGVPVETSTRTNPDGSTTQVVTIPVVTPDRPEEVGNNTVADIPLAGPTAAPLLLAQLPTGVGLQVAGSPAPKPAGSSLTDLIREIQAHTAPGSAEQTQMTGGGAGFLGGLDATTPLLVRTVTPTAPAGSAAPGQPLVLQGSTAPDAPQTALVIDARGLPAGSAIQLQDVAFAAVIGSARVTGGAGAQTVWGDGAGQYIVLGADDDELHGGAGNDTVGSEGGDDRLFGDAGDDLLFGGSGDDRLDGGDGADTVLLAGTRAQHHFTHGVAGLRISGPDGEDVAVNIEALRTADGEEITDLIDLVDDTTSVASLTYQFFTGRAPTGAGLEYLLHAPDAVNGADLTDAYYQGFNLENRYINFAMNLASEAGEAHGWYETRYGDLDLAGALEQAYAEIFGWAPGAEKVAAVLQAQVGEGMTRQGYFEALGGPELAAAGLIGWLLAEAAKADTGRYAEANNAFLEDFMDGTAQLGVDLLAAYGQPGDGWMG